MNYKALYRTYRPHSFDTVVGQKHIIQTLQNALKQDKVSHAYLFSGPRGTGKTTVAKLVAKSVNCLNPTEAPCNHCEHCLSIQNGTHPDVIEIDAASNNGVDEIRELIEKVKYAPLQARYKVYIIDEVHMLTQGAFNALLKTLEEPPSHVIFILATTEAHKVIPTIISRCQRYDFVRVSTKDIQTRLEEVLKAEKIKFDPEATRLISQLADGGVRDALSILEQVIAYSNDELNTGHVNDIYGIATTQDKLRLLDAIISHNVSELMNEIEFIATKNIDIKRLTNDLMELIKESVVYSYTKDEKLLNKLSVEEAQSLTRIQPKIGLKMIEDLMDTAEKYRSASDLMAYFEIGLLKVMGHLSEKVSDVKKIEVVKTKEKNVVKEEVKAVEVAIQALEEEVVEVVDKVEIEEKDLDLKQDVKLSSEPLSAEKIVELFVSGDRVMRTKLDEQWRMVNDYKLDLKYGRCATLLGKTIIRACNNDFIAVSHIDDDLVSEINSEDLKALFSDFLEKLFGQKRILMAMSDDHYNEAVELFKKHTANNSLPKAKKIVEEQKLEEVKVINKEQALFDLFGEENVEII
jgi:DNA polymerase III subunit gamma/tau